MKEKSKKSLNLSITKNVKKLFYFTLAFLIIIPICLCLVLKLGTGHIPGNLFVITPAISDWMAFYASYSGTIVSSILGLITLYLTVKLDSLNSESLAQRNRLSIVTNVPNMACENIRLYALSEGDLPFEYLRQFSKESNYLLLLCMKPAFPPYFQVEIQSIAVKLKNPLKDDERIEPFRAELTSKDYRITNNDTFQVAINMPASMDDSMQRLYFMKWLTTEGTEFEKTMIDLWIEISCSNVLLEPEQGDIKFKLHVVFENLGKKDNNGIELKIINRQFERIL